MASVAITIKTEEAATVMQELIQKEAGKPKENCIALAQIFKELAAGMRSASFDVQTGSADPVAAAATLTLDTVIATDVVTVGAITFTGTDTPTTELHFDTDAGSDTLIAADIAAKINAHSVLQYVVKATSAAAVVTVTALQKGVAGNQIPIASVDSTITASAAFLEDGAGGVAEEGIHYEAGIA